MAADQTRCSTEGLDPRAPHRPRRYRHRRDAAAASRSSGGARENARRRAAQAAKVGWLVKVFENLYMCSVLCSQLTPSTFVDMHRVPFMTSTQCVRV
jgi:hypothetical protein